jgi:hypothetical protein
VTVRARRAPAARGAAAVGLAVVAIAFAAVVGLAALRERGQAEAAQARLLAAFHSEANDVTLAFAPGFFISPGTLPGPRRYFMIDSGDQVPAPAVQAVREKAAAGGGRMAVLLRSRALESGAIASFIAQQHLDVQDMLQSGPFAVLVLGIPAGKSDVALTTVETTVDVPAGAVLSVRLDPTAFAKVPVTIDELALADASGTHPIDLCADARLQLVRSVRLGETAEGCSFIMGNEANAGWLAPTQLRNLPAAAGPRRLKLRMSGELSDEIRFYFDTGSGYHSPLRLKTQDIDLPAGARAPADESAPGPVNAPLPVAR